MYRVGFQTVREGLRRPNGANPLTIFVVTPKIIERPISG